MNDYDVLIAGTGVAGLYAALNFAPDVRVLVLSKRESTLCNSFLAQGGVAAVVDKEHKAAAQALRKILAKYAKVELLVQIGEYKKGSDKEADDALARINAVNAFLRQGLDEKSTFEETLQALYKVVA